MCGSSSWVLSTELSGDFCGYQVMHGELTHPATDILLVHFLITISDANYSYSVPSAEPHQFILVLLETPRVGQPGSSA